MPDFGQWSKIDAHLAELVDAGDLKSSGLDSPSGFESRGEHHLGVQTNPGKDSKLFILLSFMPFAISTRTAKVR